MAEPSPKPSVPPSPPIKSVTGKVALGTGKIHIEPPVALSKEKAKTPPPMPPSQSVALPGKPISFPKVGMMSKEPAPLLSRRKGPPAPEPDGPIHTSGPPDLASKTLTPAPEVKTLLPAVAKAKIAAFPDKPLVPPTPPPAPAVTVATQSALPTSSAPAPAPADAFKQDPIKAFKPTVQPPLPVEKPKREPILPRGLRNTLLRVAVWIVLLGGIVSLGYTTYLMLRETRLEGLVAAPGYQISQVALVRDFRPEAVTLADELALARAPMLADIQELEDFISRARSDIAGREERLRLLQQELANINKATDSVIGETNAASKKLWDEVGTNLDQEYEQKRQELGDRLLARANEIKIKFELNQEFKSPEVWVNAFRLALYDAPKGINAVDQREWAEKQLSDWKDYLVAYDKRMGEVKTKIDEVQASPKDKVAQINVRRADLEDQINQTEAELKPLRNELKQHEASLTSTKGEEEALEGNFYPQLLESAESSKLYTLPVNSSTGEFSWRHIDHMPQYPPGTYWLWIKAQKGDKEYWSVMPFSLNSYQTTQIIVKPGALISALDVLRSGKLD